MVNCLAIMLPMYVTVNDTLTNQDYQDHQLVPHVKVVCKTARATPFLKLSTDRLAIGPKTTHLPLGLGVLV